MPSTAGTPILGYRIQSRCARGADLTSEFETRREVSEPSRGLTNNAGFSGRMLVKWRLFLRPRTGVGHVMRASSRVTNHDFEVTAMKDPESGTVFAGVDGRTDTELPD